VCVCLLGSNFFLGLNSLPSLLNSTTSFQNTLYKSACGNACKSACVEAHVEACGSVCKKCV
jgi:hypothetical protein